MPRGHEHNPFSIYERLSGHVFLKLSWNKIVMGKKIVVPCLATSFPGFSPNHLRVGRVGENSGNEVSVFDGLFPEKYTVKDHISTDRAHAPWTSHNTP